MAKSSKKTSFSFTKIIVLFTVAAMGFFIYKVLAPVPQKIGINEVTTSGHITLTLSDNVPSNLPTYTPKFTPGKTKQLRLYIDTSTVKSSGVTVEITYPPSILSIESVTNGGFFSQVLGTPTFTNGKIAFTYGATPDSGGVNGSGTVATITVKALKEGPATLGFGAPTVATAIGIETNDLLSANPINIMVNILGDIDGDHKVGLLDFNLFVANYGLSEGTKTKPSTMNPEADLDHSGKVDLLDYNLFVADYGKEAYPYD